LPPKIAANQIMDLCDVYDPDRIGRWARPSASASARALNANP